MAVPRLTAACTAYAFLTVHLPAVIREEPRRMRMGIWSSGGDEVVGEIASDLEEMDHYRRGWSHYRKLAEEMIPTCGTVGCIGGWTEMMCGSGEPAVQLLGLTREQDRELFFPSLVMASDQGTPEHAERVIEHMLAFAEKYRTQLEAVVVPAYEE